MIYCILIYIFSTNPDLSKDFMNSQYQPFLREYSIRNEPIGCDRYNNKYYLFRGEPGYLFVSVLYLIFRIIKMNLNIIKI